MFPSILKILTCYHTNLRLVVVVWGRVFGEFHRKCVLVPADGAAGSVVIVWRLHCIDTLKQELSGTGACGRTSEQGGICHR